MARKAAELLAPSRPPFEDLRDRALVVLILEMLEKEQNSRVFSAELEREFVSLKADALEALKGT